METTGEACPAAAQKGGTAAAEVESESPAAAACDEMPTPQGPPVVKTPAVFGTECRGVGLGGHNFRRAVLAVTARARRR